MASRAKKKTGSKKKTTRKDKAVGKTDVTTGDAEEPKPAVEDAASPAATAEPAPETVAQVADLVPETPEPTPDQVSPVPTAVPPASVRDPRLPPVGSTITRIFKGRKLQVLVTDTGFQFEGQTYPSISRLAKVITGHRAVNGYAFFKLGTSAGGKGTARHVVSLASKIRKLDALIVKLRAALSEAALALADAEAELEEMKKKAAELRQSE